MSYFVFHISEDDDVYFERVEIDDFLQDIEDGSIIFFNDVPDNFNALEWPWHEHKKSRYLLIKGEIIAPKVEFRYSLE